MKILPLFVRASRLPMRRSEEKMEEEVKEEVELTVAAIAGGDGVLIEETNELRSCCVRPILATEAESVSEAMMEGLKCQKTSE